MLRCAKLESSPRSIDISSFAIQWSRITQLPFQKVQLVDKILSLYTHHNFDVDIDIVDKDEHFEDGSCIHYDLFACHEQSYSQTSNQNYLL